MLEDSPVLKSQSQSINFLRLFARYEQLFLLRCNFLAPRQISSRWLLSNHFKLFLEHTSSIMTFLAWIFFSNPGMFIVMVQRDVETSNYRPISVLPVVARLLETLVFDQMYSYLYSKQSGFRSMHSVLSCLLKCMNDCYLNLDKGNFTSFTLIDLKKAFDKVNLEILLKKTYLYGIQDKEFC